MTPCSSGCPGSPALPPFQAGAPRLVLIDALHAAHGRLLHGETCSAAARGTEIIVEVSDDEPDGGCTANAPGFGMRTEGGTLDELRGNIREAVDCCCFDGSMEHPRPIRLHYVRDEVLVA